MNSNSVTYPLTFLLRPCDDALRHELIASGSSDEVARLMCFLVWQNFAIGGSARREVSPEGPLSADQKALAVERACGWSGEPGAFLDLAVTCGFLTIESTESGRFLTCYGFQEYNRGKVKTIQRQGGLVRALKSHLRDAEKLIEDKEVLWSRTGGGVFEGVAPDRRRSAMVFLMRICRALSKTLPSDAALSNGTILLAAKCVEQHADSIEGTLLWVFDRRAEIQIPDRLDEIIRAWPEYTRKAAEEREQS